MCSELLSDILSTILSDIYSDIESDDLFHARSDTHIYIHTYLHIRYIYIYTYTHICTHYIYIDTLYIRVIHIYSCFMCFRAKFNLSEFSFLLGQSSMLAHLGSCSLGVSVSLAAWIMGVPPIAGWFL